MKTIDQSYSYDELEGFKPLVIEQVQRSKADVGLTVSSKVLRPTAEAKKVIFARSHIHFFFNPDSRQLLLVSAPGSAPNAISVVNPKALALHCKFLRDLLSKECRIDLTNHLIYIPGQISKSKKNAVIFDLSRAESRKKKTRNK